MSDWGTSEQVKKYVTNLVITRLNKCLSSTKECLSWKITQAAEICDYFVFCNKKWRNSEVAQVTSDQ